MRALIASATDADVRVSSPPDCAGACFCAAAACGDLRGFAGPFGRVGRGHCDATVARRVGRLRRRRVPWRSRPTASSRRGVRCIRLARCCSAAMRRAWSISHGFDSAIVRGAAPSGLDRPRTGADGHAGGFEQIDADVFGQTRRRCTRARAAGTGWRALAQPVDELAGHAPARGLPRRPATPPAVSIAALPGHRFRRGGFERGLGVSSAGARSRACGHRFGTGFRARAEHRREHIGHAARVRIRLHRSAVRAARRAGGCPDVRIRRRALRALAPRAEPSA